MTIKDMMTISNLHRELCVHQIMSILWILLGLMVRGFDMPLWMTILVMICFLFDFVGMCSTRLEIRVIMDKIKEETDEQQS